MWSDLDELDDAHFRRYLAAQRDLWEPGNLREFEHAGGPPTKDVVLGAWRDLDRSEAFLELIDNSIDAWLVRRRQYPRRTPDELDIYIDINSDAHQLSYEDNAGGVQVDKLSNLVVPGFSDTTSLSQTIGSYKTGGKKAIFRLAKEARITTRYWNPVGTDEYAVSVHLDEQWMNDPTLYEFSYARLKDPTVIERGQTRYVFQLREDSVGAQWFEIPEEIKKITRMLRQTYTLLLVRNPNIHIHFKDRANPLTPDDQLYQFSETHDEDVDIRSQRITFQIELEFEGKGYPVELEVLLGCRTTTGVPEGKSKSWGIDLYGNDRLFVAYDQDTFADCMPASNARQLVRGYVNIKGPNIFIPWDTHKRHLNTDREVMRILTKHKLIRELFENWKGAYNNIGRAGKGEVTRIIRNPVQRPFDSHAKDIHVAHLSTITIKSNAARGASLPQDIFIPKVEVSKNKKNDSVKVNLTFSLSEARLLASCYGLEGDIKPNDLGQEIKQDILNRAGRGRKR